MTDDFDSRVRALQEDLIEPAAMLMAWGRLQADKVRQQTMPAYGRLTDAHLLLSGVLAAALLRISGKIVPAGDSTAELNGLFASFVIGMDTCERTIAEGAYLQAGALLRQEMETVARMVEVRQGRQRDGRQANVAMLEESLARLYGSLSDAAHVAQPDIVRLATEHDLEDMEVPGPTSAARFFPVFNRETARRLFAVHLLLMGNLIQEMSIEHDERHNDDDGFSARDVQAVQLAMALMQQEGMVEPGPQAA